MSSPEQERKKVRGYRTFVTHPGTDLFLISRHYGSEFPTDQARDGDVKLMRSVPGYCTYREKSGLWWHCYTYRGPKGSLEASVPPPANPVKRLRISYAEDRAATSFSQQSNQVCDVYTQLLRLSVL